MWPCLKIAFPAYVQRALICTVTSFSVLMFAVFFPGFHTVMALLGSFFSFTISVVFPITVYIKFYGSNLRLWELALEFLVGLLGIIFGLLGTIWVVLSL